MALTEPNTIQLSETLLVDVDPEKQYVTFRLGDQKAQVGKTDLWAAIFAIADPQTQEELMPVKQTEVMHYHKVHTVECKRDMRKGERIKVRCQMSVPLMVVEGLKGMVEKEMKKSIILPR